MPDKQKTQSIRVAGYLLAIGATILWSGNFIIARGLSESIHPVSLAFWRWVVAVAFLLPFGIRSLINEWQVIKSNFRYLLLTALIGVTIFNTLIYVAGHTTTAVNLSLIAITIPIFILILSQIFYREMITMKKAAGVFITITGILLLISNGSVATLLHIRFAIGDLLMLLASIIFAFYSILVKKIPARLSMNAFLLSTFIMGLIPLFPLYLWERSVYGAGTFGSSTILSILYVGIFASLVAFFMWNKAILKIGPAKTSLVYYTLPVFSGVLALLFLDEPITGIHVFSMLLIISGIAIASHEVDKTP
jgi:drug/metabolite transporter (DMT)-like permease